MTKSGKSDCKKGHVDGGYEGGRKCIPKFCGGMEDTILKKYHELQKSHQVRMMPRARPFKLTLSIILLHRFIIISFCYFLNSTYLFVTMKILLQFYLLLLVVLFHIYADSLCILLNLVYFHTYVNFTSCSCLILSIDTNIAYIN